MVNAKSGIPVLRRQVEERKDQVLGHVLSRAGRLFTAEAVSAIQGRGHGEVRESWIAILRHMEPDGVRTSELARRMGITKQGVGQMVTDLERSGYLERSADPTDGRAKLVRMTERGWSAWLAGLDAMAELEASLVGSFSGEDLTRLRALLSRMVLAMEKRDATRASGAVR